MASEREVAKQSEPDNKPSNRLPRIVWIGALVIGAALYITLISQSSRFECSECVTDADCEAPDRCLPFDDGQRRCVERAWACAEGHVRLPGWAQGVLLGVAAVGALAFALERQVPR